MDKRILSSIPILTSSIRGTKSPDTTAVTRASFKQHLVEASQPTSLSITKHAGLRLAQRDITISPREWSMVEEQLVVAKNKGITDALVLLENAALIVSVPNKTVITAMNRKESTGQVFTNINGTILLAK